MELADWHTNLHSWFTERNAERAQNEGALLFALEHNLECADIEQLREDLATSLENGNNPQWTSAYLAWAVYAAEKGYDFEGSDYWRNFRKDLPGWEPEMRQKIREAFMWFCAEFPSGMKPTGAWAEHRTIICWPICHAILPKDLQYHLAKVLHELRRISEEECDTPQLLGRRIRRYAWTGSDRFQKFAENEILVGQVAAALLMHGHAGHTGSLLPQAINRITSDLEEVAQAKAWIKTARESISGAITGTEEGARPEAELFLRCVSDKQQGEIRGDAEPGEKWELYLKIQGVNRSRLDPADGMHSRFYTILHRNPVDDDAEP